MDSEFLVHLIVQKKFKSYLFGIKYNCREIINVLSEVFFKRKSYLLLGFRSKYLDLVDLDLIYLNFLEVVIFIAI